MNETISRDIIIIGGNHHNTLGIIRALGFKGLKKRIYLILDDDDKAFVSRSRYVKNKNIIYANTEQNIYEAVKSIAYKCERKPVLIACGDKYISIIDNNFNQLQSICILPNAKFTQGRINCYLEKSKQSEIASKYGISVPYSMTMPIYKLIEAKLFPYIVKPINSVGGSKSDIVIIHTEEDSKKYIEKHSNDKNKQVRVEKFIKKSEEFQLIGCSLPDNIIIPGYSSIIRQPENTNTGYLVYRPIQDGFISYELLEKVKYFIREIGYLGLFSVEFLRDDSRKDYFLEINMRNDGNAYCVTTAGVNLPYIWYKYNYTNTKTIKETLRFDKTIYWMPEADIRNIRIIGYLKWIIEWFSSHSHGIVCIKDPYPFFYHFFRKIIQK